MYRRGMQMVTVGLMLALTTSTSAQVQGKALIEYWFGNGVGSNLDSLKANADFPDNPADGEYLDAMDLPDQAAWDHWGARLRAWLTPPYNGAYTFWTASDDDSEVWLSTNDDPANAKLICSVEGWGGYRDWTGTTGPMGPDFKSKPVTLQAGKRYYIEALVSDGTGGGFVSVAWAGPGIGSTPTVISGAYLSAPVGDVPFIARSPVPASGAVGVTSPLFMWTCGRDAATDRVYFGTNPNPSQAEFRFKQLSWQQRYFHADILQPGVIYYWRVDTTDIMGVLHTGKVWSFTVKPLKASMPNPADGAEGQPAKLTLSWDAGQNLPKHNLYLGTDKAAVTAGAPSVYKGNLANATLHTDALAYDTVYYWRVDEIDIMGMKSIGDVWTFKTILGKIKREIWEDIGGTAISNLANDVNFPLKPTWSDMLTNLKSPDLGIGNYGGRMSAWLHAPTTGDYTFWIASGDSSELWLGTTPGTAKLIAFVGGRTGADEWTKYPPQRSVVQNLQEGAYFIDALWKGGSSIGHCSVAWQGPGIPREVIPGGYCDPFIAYWAQAPKPSNGADNISRAPTLTWAPGVKAVKHNIYVGEVLKDMTDATPRWPQFKASLDATVTTFSLGELISGRTYYWRVDEINDTEESSPWKGAVWSFRVAD